MCAEGNGNLVAYCGLFCGECGAYTKGRCKGCRDGGGYSRCKVRICCTDKGIVTCADCDEFPDPRDCRKTNNWISKTYSLFFKKDRFANLEAIKRSGVEGFARERQEQSGAP